MSEFYGSGRHKVSQDYPPGFKGRSPSVRSRSAASFDRTRKSL